MTGANETLLLTTISGLAPGGLALLLAVAAYIQSQAASASARNNQKRLDHLENGGGDAKIDTRLAAIGLVDRRGGGDIPTPKAVPAPADTPAPAPEVTAGRTDGKNSLSDYDAAGSITPFRGGLHGAE